MEEKEFDKKVVAITGVSGGIGRCLAEEFTKAGAKVIGIDLKERSEWFDGLYYQGDISRKDTLENFVDVIDAYLGYCNILINNALPAMKGIDECSYEDFCYAQRVGVIAPFYLSKLLKDYMPKGSSIINISSSRDRMSQPQTESYTAAKGGISALTHALAVSLGPGIRVNSISPGWIDTTNTDYDSPDASQHPCGRVGNPQDIAQMVLFLCSDKASFITGENICIDGGMTKLMIYHNDNGWKLEDDGK